MHAVGVATCGVFPRHGEETAGMQGSSAWSVPENLALVPLAHQGGSWRENIVSLLSTVRPYQGHGQPEGKRANEMNRSKNEFRVTNVACLMTPMAHLKWEEDSTCKQWPFSERWWPRPPVRGTSRSSSEYSFQLIGLVASVIIGIMAR